MGWARHIVLSRRFGLAAARLPSQRLIPRCQSTSGKQHQKRPMQDSLVALTQQRDHAAIWGESLAISARRLPFNLFQRFQMESLALMNRYLGMAERGEDPDQIQSQSFMHQPQMEQPQQQYLQHDNSWPFYTNMAPGPPLLQSFFIQLLQ